MEWNALNGAEQPQRKMRTRSNRGTHGRASQAAWSCHPHHRQPVVVAVRVSSIFPLHCVLVLVFGPWVLPWSSTLGLLRLFYNLPWPIWPQLHSFRLLLSSIYVNLKSKTPTSQNNCNRRNRGVNHKIKHIKPQEWVLNTELIHAYDTYHRNKDKETFERENDF